MNKLGVVPFTNACKRSEMTMLISIIQRSNGYKPLIIDSKTYKELL